MLLKSEILNTIRKRIDEAKYIPNYSDYVVLPNEGLVYSLKRNKFIGAKNPEGYWYSSLYSDNGEKWVTNLHRAIWTTVNGPIPQGLEVNHIDENKSNNSIDNLNLLTRKENNNYGTRNERTAKALSKPVGMYKDGKLIFTFPSAREAQRNGFDSSTICKCCKGVKGYKTYKGYEWRFIEKESV